MDFKCPVCDTDASEGCVSCKECGWEFHVFVTPPDTTTLLSYKEKLENARKAWHQQVIKPPTREELTREDFDTPEEFMVQLEQLGVVKAGTATLLKHRYNVYSGRFPLELCWDDWVEPLKPHVEEPYLEADRDLARALYQASDTHNLYVRLTTTTDSKLARIREILLKASDKELPVRGVASARIDLGFSNADWVTIPAGEFLMGSPEKEQGRGIYERLHRVRIGAFKLMAKAVTFIQYDLFCEATGRKTPSDWNWRRGNHPVTHVSYWDAVDYAQWLKHQTGWLCRLPTEAEWEYACRAGTRTRFWWGNTITPSQANCNGNRKCTVPVDSFAPNPWGLYQMHGNVWEWCASEYDAGYSGLEMRDASGDRRNTHQRVLRGGSWDETPQALRAAVRGRLVPTYRHRDNGFRLARDV